MLIPPIPQIILPLYHRNRVRTTCANNTIPLHLPTACVNISLSLFFLTVIFLLLLFCTYDLRVRVERCSSHLPYRPTGPGWACSSHLLFLFFWPNGPGRAYSSQHHFFQILYIYSFYLILLYYHTITTKFGHISNLLLPHQHRVYHEEPTTVKNLPRWTTHH